MIDFYYWPTPNGQKVAIMLEESGLPYRVKPVNILRGEQFRPGFLRVNPNNKIPAIVDRAPADVVAGARRTAAPMALFESGAILQYLAHKSGKFLPTLNRQHGREHWQVIQWLSFQIGNVGPMFGQCGHFLGYAPRKIPYAIDRYRNETLRLYGVMNRQLAKRHYLAGAYSIADMATWPWVRVRWLHKIELAEFPHVARWYERIAARPAVERAVALLATDEKIGSPDSKAREALFGGTQLRQGKKVTGRTKARDGATRELRKRRISA